MNAMAKIREELGSIISFRKACSQTEIISPRQSRELLNRRHSNGLSEILMKPRKEFMVDANQFIDWVKSVYLKDCRCPVREDR